MHGLPVCLGQYNVTGLAHYYCYRSKNNTDTKWYCRQEDITEPCLNMCCTVFSMSVVLLNRLERWRDFSVTWFFLLRHISYSACQFLTWLNCWWEWPSICCQWHIEPWSIFTSRDVAEWCLFNSSFPFRSSNVIITNTLLKLQCIFFLSR